MDVELNRIGSAAPASVREGVPVLDYRRQRLDRRFTLLSAATKLAQGLIYLLIALILLPTAALNLAFKHLAELFLISIPLFCFSFAVGIAFLGLASVHLLDAIHTFRGTMPGPRLQQVLKRLRDQNEF